MRPGYAALSTDVCVPISRLADCVEDTQRDIAETGLLAPIVGHVGDGNFHVIVNFDANDPAEVAQVEAFMERLVDRALAMEGTCTGEHGVGQQKRKYLQREHSPAALDAMRAIKTALDPRGIMNPGKISCPDAPAQPPLPSPCRHEVGYGADHPEPGTARRLRDILTGLAILLIVAITAAMAGPWFVDWSAYRSEFERRIGEAVGMPVSIDGPSTSSSCPPPASRWRPPPPGRPAAARRSRSVARSSSSPSCRCCAATCA